MGDRTFLKFSVSQFSTLVLKIKKKKAHGSIIPPRKDCDHIFTGDRDVPLNTS